MMWKKISPTNIDSSSLNFLLTMCILKLDAICIKFLYYEGIADYTCTIVLTLAMTTIPHHVHASKGGVGVPDKAIYLTYYNIHRIKFTI